MKLMSSPLKKMNEKSILGSMQTLKNSGEPGNVGHKGKGEFVLPLTSLIDAFSIIVIYLLIGTQSGGIESDVPHQIKLPIAETGIQLLEESPTIRIEKGRYFLNNEPVTALQLGSKLAQLKQKSQKQELEIVIQADHQMTYAYLDPLLRAGSEAGIQKLKFAVTTQK